MTPFVFDTLSASKQLREAGMAEGVAEAVVSVFQHAAAMPDVSHLATKADLEALGAATRADLEALSVATKADIAQLATKADIAQVKLEIANLRASVNETIRHQGWMLLGGVGVLVTILNGLMKMFG
ncbi:MAG: hypothetical protein Q7U20_06970 [Caulobacter sp.]|nr:hypothetical protein [Caulobacter sp.]